MKWIITLVLAAAVTIIWPRSAAAQTLDLAMYAPAAPFANSDRAQDYVDELAATISRATGRKVRARVYFRYDDLARAKPHLAIVDARCVVAKAPGPVIATAVIGGATSQSWGIFASDKRGIPALANAKIAHDASGCRDRDFLAHGLLASELDLSYFGPLIAKPNPKLAAAAVADTRVARAAFLPAIAAGQLQRVFASDRIPTPALVRMRKLPDKLSKEIASAVTKHKSKAKISGWRAEGQGAYTRLALRMKRRSKRSLLAPPASFRLPIAGIIRLPAVPTNRPSVAHHLK
jgi:hypothetical protein